jgi:predicted RNase H-like HicB family nuclease
MFKELFREKRKIAFTIEICLENDGDEFHAYCPALKGVHIDGKTKEEAIENAKVAATLYLRSLIKHGDPIPIQMVVTGDISRALCESSNIICAPEQKHTEDIHVTV